MTTESLRLLVIGAHPDDCDIRAGGLATLYSRCGHAVKFVSMTNGDAGHHEMGGEPLANKRRAEATAAAGVIGIEYDILDIPDGTLMPTLENRLRVIRLIREFRPDLILTHRPNDYHPDHRYTSQLVQDSAYMVTVPNVCQDVPYLTVNPHIAYLSDDFQKPTPFSCDVAIDIGPVMEAKMQMLACHDSQAFEWLPYNVGVLDQVPTDPDDRLAWCRDWWHHDRCGMLPDHSRAGLCARYGDERGRAVGFVEAFEFCEYGSRFTDEAVERLFPFH